MTIEHLEIANFRNLEKVSLNPSSTINVIVGNNGSGKTSILEAIYFLGTAKSFRTPHSKQAIQFDQEQFVLFGKITSSDVIIPVGIAKQRNAMAIKISGETVSNASSLAGLLPVQLINPDVHKLLEEGPRFRRRFIEWGVFHVKPNYFAHWQQCRYILKQRNAALKQNLPAREIAHWDLVLCEKSEVITNLRMQYLSELQPEIARLLLHSKELPEVEIKLSRGWPQNKSLDESLKESIETDRSRGFTQYGPHRADLNINCDGVRAKEVVSRGQQKLITAFLKLAQLRLLSAQGTKAVLLVDDLPAELDQNFREILMQVIGEQASQVFITATDVPLLFSDRDSFDATMFHVEHGTVEKIN